MSRFLSARFAGLEAYTPGEQPQDMQYVKLNTNESPYPPSPEVFARINGDEIGKLQLYPDPEGKILRQKLADLYGVTAENIFLSNGSDDILNFAFMAFCNETHGAMFPEISYGFYPVYADLYGVQAKQVPLQADFTISAADYCKNEAMVVIANPNAPTGLELPQNDIEKIIQFNPDYVVVIDEAYIDFGGTSCVDLIHKYDNLLVVQTFSKSRSMAGMRIGFAIGSEELIACLNDVKYSFNSYTMSQAAIAAGTAAVKDEAYFRRTVQAVVETREWTKEKLRELGFVFGDSRANFIFASHPQVPAAELFRALREAHIYVRYFNKPRIDNYLRISIGTREEMETLINFLENYRNSSGQVRAHAAQTVRT